MSRTNLVVLALGLSAAVLVSCGGGGGGSTDGDSPSTTSATSTQTAPASQPAGGTTSPPKTTATSSGGASGAAVSSVRDFITKAQADGRIDTAAAGWKTRLPKFPDTTYTAGETYYWNIQTSKGDIKVKLLPETAPNHVTNFLYLTEVGFFDELTFHRVINKFMAQGGCPLGSGRGSPGYRFQGEYDPAVKHDRPGLLSMANAGPGTDGSQFFLTFVPTPWLDGKHTIFGEIVEGMDTMQALEAVGTRTGTPTEPLSLIKATITNS
ncbi:MAG: peptidylprolyl isomerase [Acidobacteriota bacterium]